MCLYVCLGCIKGRRGIFKYMFFDFLNVCCYLNDNLGMTIRDLEEINNKYNREKIRY